MKLKREDFKGIKDSLGWCNVQHIESSNSIIYNALIKDEMRCLVLLGHLVISNRITASVQVRDNDDYTVELWMRNDRLKTPEETVKWVIKTIARLEYHANELKDQ